MNISFLFTDSFVNSQEWTASRGVTELRVGVLGSADSGKSALVHRYLTGAYMQEESPEGGIHWFNLVNFTTFKEFITLKKILYFKRRIQFLLTK